MGGSDLKLIDFDMMIKWVSGFDFPVKKTIGFDFSDFLPVNDTSPSRMAI